MPTVTGKGSQGAVVGAWLVKHYGGVIGQDMDRPIGTVTGRDHHGVVNAELRAAALVTNNTGNPPSPVDGPLKTVTSGGHHALIGAELHSAPLGRAREVAAFLIKYHGNGGQWAPCDEALHTVDGTARFGLVQVELRRWMVQGQDGGFYGVEVDGEVYAAVIIDGEAWIIVDITIRMLRARELGRASGFPDSYVFEGTEEQQIERIGNAVPPHVVQALVTAQFRPARRLQEPTAKKAGTKARPMRAGGATSAGASPDRRQREERERQAGGGG
jgi:DNA (cytosine-5)-methyltransferase 1